MILYFPTLLAAGAALAGDFRPEEFGSPLFRILFLAWIADGFACMVYGVANLKMVLAGADEPATAALRGIASAAAVIIGTPPACIALELAFKALYYIRYAL